jgi:hypothetical protein
MPTIRKRTSGMPKANVAPPVNVAKAVVYGPDAGAIHQENACRRQPRVVQ